jgi:hypothetical protein
MALSLALLLGALACLLTGVWHANSLFSKSNEAMIFVIQSGGLTSEEVSQIISDNAERGEPFSMVFWTQIGEEIVEYRPVSPVDLLNRFDRLTILPSADVTTLITGETVSMTLGIEATLLDFKALALIAFLCLFLALLLPLVLLIVVFIRIVLSDITSWQIKAFMGVLIAACFIGVTTIFTGIISDFSSYFPTRWSASTEWRALIDDFALSVNLVFAMPRQGFEEVYFASFHASVAFAFIAIVGIVIGSFLVWHSMHSKKASNRAFSKKVAV